MDHIQPANSCISNGAHPTGKLQLHWFYIQLETSSIIDNITCRQYTVASAEVLLHLLHNGLEPVVQIQVSVTKPVIKLLQGSLAHVGLIYCSATPCIDASVCPGSHLLSSA